LALAAGTDAGEQVLRQIFDSLDQQRLANLDGLLNAIEPGDCGSPVRPAHRIVSAKRSGRS
jgi:hypothetical protein